MIAQDAAEILATILDEELEEATSPVESRKDWGILSDAIQEAIGPGVFLPIESGVYRHGIKGAFTSLQEAIAAGAESIRAEEDHYHDIEVIFLQIGLKASEIQGISDEDWEGSKPEWTVLSIFWLWESLKSDNRGKSLLVRTPSREAKKRGLGQVVVGAYGSKSRSRRTPLLDRMKKVGGSK